MDKRSFAQERALFRYSMRYVFRDSCIVVYFGLQCPLPLFKEARLILFYAVIMMATRNVWYAEMVLGVRLSSGRCWYVVRYCCSSRRAG